MSPADAVQHVVQRAIADLNALLPVDRAVGLDEDSPLATGLDSLGVVNLILAVESGVEQTLGVSVSLTDLLERGGGDSPLATVGSFTQLVRGRIPSEPR